VAVSMNIVKGVDEELCQEYKACQDEEFLRTSTKVLPSSRRSRLLGVFIKTRGMQEVPSGHTRCSFSVLYCS
jgi:hypothetical protein